MKVTACNTMHMLYNTMQYIAIQYNTTGTYNNISQYNAIQQSSAEWACIPDDIKYYEILIIYYTVLRHIVKYYNDEIMN